MGSVIGHNIRKIRHDRNVTQWQLACSLHITTGAMWMIERGERPCPPEMVKAIAEALHVSENQIYGRKQ